MGSIEAQLVSIVEDRIKAYQQQDLRCSKCGEVLFRSSVSVWQLER